MSIDQEVEILRRIPIFAKIDPAKLKLMAFASERVTYKPGQALFRQGERGEAAFIVLEGAADVLIAASDGPLRVASLSENEIIDRKSGVAGPRVSGRVDLGGSRTIKKK